MKQNSSRVGRAAGVILGVAFAGLSPTFGETFEVSTNADSGAGSLRQAILNANADPGAHTIVFSIPGAGVKTITPVTPLPALFAPTVIDGYTQPGASANTQAVGDNAVLRIELDGINLGSGGAGIILTGGGNKVQGLIINRFRGCGILVQSSSSDVIVGNFIGTDSSGTNARPNAYGILLEYASKTRIGGTTPAERNILSGNTGNGIRIGSLNFDDFNENIEVAGNYIGVARSGLTVLSNSNSGISVATGANNVIGGTTIGARNVISGNRLSGIHFYFFATDNDVLGNYIGLSADGRSRVGNGGPGIYVEGVRTRVGGLAEGAMNSIWFNGGAGVFVEFGLNNSILGNSIFSNTARGIHLTLNDVIPNDPGDLDTGPNNLQNFPVLTSADIGTNIIITGAFNSSPNTTFLLQFFTGTNRDSSFFGEGQSLVGSESVTTSDTGDQEFNFAFPFPGFGQQWITATATDPEGNTSEFSRGLAPRLTTFPYIYRLPASLVVTQGDSATFSLEIYGARPISYQWRRNGADLSGENNTNLVLTNVQWAEHHGNYTVVLSNSFGVVESTPVALFVRVRPQIILQPLSQRIAPGEPVTMSVMVSNSAPLPLIYQWRRNGLTVASVTNVQHTSFFTVTNETANAAYSVAVSNIYWPSAIISANAFLTLLPDTDHDGLPDEYELAYQFDSGDPNDAGLDSDGDGASNANEYAAGTDPRNPSSRLQVDRIEFSDGTLLLEFLAVSNKSYSVQFKSALDSAGWLTLTNFAARRTNSLMVVTDLALPSQRFFRLATPPEP